MSVDKQKSIFMAVALSLFVFVVSFSGVIIYRVFDLSFDASAYELVTDLLTLALVLFLFFRYRSSSSGTDLRDNILLTHTWYVATFLAALAVASLTMTLGTKIFNLLFTVTPEHFARINPTNEALATQSLVAFLLIVIIGPIIEEISFRQLLFKAWSKVAHPVTAMVVANVFFTFLHLPYPVVGATALCKFLLVEAPPVFVAGLAYGFARIKLSLWHAIGMHVAFNLYVYSAADSLKMDMKIAGLICIPLLIVLHFATKSRRRATH